MLCSHLIANAQQIIQSSDTNDFRIVIAKPEFTGEDAQLWRIEQLTDGTYRIMPKAVPGTEEKLALVSLGDCTPGLAPFDFNSDNSKWNFRQP